MILLAMLLGLWENVTGEKGGKVHDHVNDAMMRINEHNPREDFDVVCQMASRETQAGLLVLHVPIDIRPPVP